MFKRGVLLLMLLSVNCFFAQKIKLPFELSKDHSTIFLRLPMENQKDSLLFFFDTGAGALLLDTQKAKELGLKADYKKDITGAGGKKTYESIRNYKVYLDKNNYVDSTSVVLEDMSRLYAMTEKKFDGIIGATILKNYITKLDFNTQMMSLYNFGTKVDYSGYEKIPFKFYNGALIQFPITMTLNNNEQFSGDILFDSGASTTLIINTPYKEKHDLLSKTDKKISYSSDNLSNSTSYEKGLIKSLRLGSYEIQSSELSVSFSSDTEGVSAVKGLMGILGSEIIHRFDLIFDYKDQSVYIKPNDLFAKEFRPFVKPLSLMYNDKRDQILISSVIHNTEAAVKGLKKGQRIISVNGISTNDIDKYEAMLREENKKVIIEYMNLAGEIKVVEIDLVRLL
ncbi:aspartyl protease family protein [Myroides odoratimimus]|uniref:aspartyl protease family protein n=1 Tax=Myroides odoratimimus TaxID=76832 RepID=UPI0004693FE9|nr:aspartyl protease family protein [Myroides odoratimimus]